MSNALCIRNNLAFSLASSVHAINCDMLDAIFTLSAAAHAAVNSYMFSKQLQSSGRSIAIKS
jgi:hypothetical protein